MAAADLPARDPGGWARATQHPFLTGVRDGTLPEAVFNEWLVQDYHFVTDLLRFQARLLARAPRAAQAVLAHGAVALVEELAWFEQHAGTRGLDLSAPPSPAAVSYAELLQRLDGTDVEVALTMLWAVERVYLDAWSHAAPGAPAYREFVDHWTTTQFRQYVAALATAADDALAHVGDAAGVYRWFTEVINAETNFWDMAWTGVRQ
jgi:thiaminase